jgi:hypothetical protein
MNLLLRFSAPLLASMTSMAVSAGCFLDSTPLLDADSAVASPATGIADAGRPVSAQPQAATGEPDASAPDAGTMDAGSPSVTVPPPPPASQGMTDAATPPPPASDAAAAASDAAPTMPPATAHCDGLGSYGLRAAIDVTWDATAWADVGRGTADLLGLARVESIDAATHAVSASFRVCGLSFPTLDSSATCSSYQLLFPDDTFEEGKLPEQPITGTYECDGADCTLRFEPVSYAMGVRLAEPHGRWPDFDDISKSQFSDDDADGLAGVSVDVVTLASVPWSAETACMPTPDMPQMPVGARHGAARPGPDSAYGSRAAVAWFAHAADSSCGSVT